MPLNLFEQFRRFSNIYFLINAVISLIPIAAPVSPFTSIAPLVFVLGVTAIKDAIEDHRRYVSDRQANSQEFEVLRGGTMVNVISKDIVSGDLVHVKKRQMFPADLIVLWSSGEEGLCFIETANLDGETNLKRRYAPKITADLPDARAIGALRATVTCEVPNVRLYHFEGNLKVGDGPLVPLAAQNLLQRGAELRNTESVFGLVVYAGVDTKLFKNLDATVSKVGHLETMLNRTVVGLFCCQIGFILISAAIAGVFQQRQGLKLTYVQDSSTPVSVGGVMVLSYFVLYTYLIPISLFVTMEIVRLLQAVFMLWDAEMAGNKPRNSNANENLGLIQHIFSDKTGTLTRNIMRLTRFYIDGAAFDEETEVGSTRRLSRDKPVIMRKVDDFLRCVALCNTAVPDHEDTPGKVVYQADSPDEVALLQAAQNNGFELWNRRADTIIIKENGEERSYKVLATLEFTADRKRMSVVYDTGDGTPRLICKGADSYIIERSRRPDPLLDQMQVAVDKYASEGLRTLVYAEKTLDRAAFAVWHREFQAANSSLANREALVHDVCERLETELVLLGCTAVEDRLQDKVPETLKYLFEAGIQLWLLTGDKQETAINIGRSSQLLLPEFEIVVINATDSHHCGTLLRQHESYYEAHPDVLFAVVIDGKSLESALGNFPLHFISLGARAKSVIVCRATPLQKARVVRLARQQLKVMALAIGDGSNDVAMIQEAEVGVGIMGREGSQAARASDYAISEFQHLRRLVCVHGRYCYLRSSGLIQYSFYKNIAYILPQFLFGFYSGFTAQVFYDEWNLSLFNIIFTSLPPLIYGFTEKDVSEATIDAHPAVYKRLQGMPLYNLRTVLVWVANAVYHALIYFFFNVASGVGTDPSWANGHVGDQWMQGILGSCVGITTALLRMALFIKHWTILTHISIWGSLAIFYVWLSAYTVWWYLQPNMFHVFFTTVTSGRFWFAYIITVAACLLPDTAVMHYSRWYHPKDWQILQEQEVLLQSKGGLKQGGEASRDAPKTTQKVSAKKGLGL